MIIIYYSNRLEGLKEILIKLISNQKLDNPLSPEIILSESIPMMEWLYMKISEYFGISANIQHFSSCDFIWNILGKSLWGIFPKNVISHSTISWIFMKILSNIKNEENIVSDFSVIQEYLHDDVNKYKCLQLSETFKKLFIQYFMYHQDWLFQWEHEKMIQGLDVFMQSWESKLWRLFLKEVNTTCKGSKSFFYFRNRIYEYIMNFFKKNDVNLYKLPQRIFIYGISYFPPLLLEILQSLGKYINIYIFCINPCRFFIKQNINYNNVMNVTRQSTCLLQCFSNMRFWSAFDRKVFLFNQAEFLNNFDRSLLFFWGSRFQETFYSLLRLDVAYEEKIFFENMNSSSLLHMLQNDVLNGYSQTVFPIVADFSVKNHINSDLKKRLLYSIDRSLSVHVCHNIQREIEVLHDNLLAMISDDPVLLPHEIIVMAPNINDYVSSIYSVFNSSSIRGRYLPFTVFDNSVNQMNIIISSFLKLLNLSHIKSSVEEILELLSVPALALRFNLDKDGVKLLSTWIIESGICWSLDDEILPDFTKYSNDCAQYTWSFGITRMLLSYAINSTSGFWNNILPYDVGDNISSMELVGQLSYFLVKLKYWKDRFSKFCTLREWLPLAEEIINDFYIINYDIETESTLLRLKSFWREIIHSGIEANYHGSISINILYRKLCDKLNKRTIKKRFFSGGIIFCNIDSVESIPFKVICLLGINVNVYPMNNKAPWNFDLMKYEVRFSDSHAWCDNRYLFLKTLLSAREKLYISFVGYSIYDYTKCFSSILIDELFQYIIRNYFYIEENTKKIFPVTIDWIHHNLCYWHVYIPFSLKNFISGKKYQSFFKEWLLFDFDNIDRGCRNFLCSLLKTPINTISFDNLRIFYFHPIRTWFQNSLKIYVPKLLQFPTNEPFLVRTQIKYKICEDLIFYFINKKDINVLYEQVRCSGVLPYGNFGNIFWIEQCEIMLKLSQVVSKHYLLTDQYDSKFSLTFYNGVKLNGVLKNIQKNGLLRWKPGVLSIRDGLLLWLEHLVYCSIGGKGDSWMFGINSSWHFISLSHTEAKEYLLIFISGYLNGLITPLLLLNNSGGCWLRHCFDVQKKSISTDLNSQAKARRKLIIAWEGNQYVHGDSSDPYVSKLIPQLKDEDIESIILSAKKYFIFPMKFNL